MVHIGSVMHRANNYFEKETHAGAFTVTGGSLDVDFLMSGQYFRVDGSALNDGVYKFGEDELIDEVFSGKVYPLSVPREFLDLVDRINLWDSKYGNVVDAPYTSESYAKGSYSYNKASLSVGAESGWPSHFANELARWRKV